MAEIKINSHVKDVKAALGVKVSVILEALGLQAQGNAIDEITNMKAVDTGRLRNSITWVTTKAQGEANAQGGANAEPGDYSPHGTADDDKVYIGTNVEYAPYIELGTAESGGRPFLKNAIVKHMDEYKKIIEDGLK